MTGSLDPPESLLGDYQRTVRTLGLARNVVVQPSFFARDKSCTFDAAGRLGNSQRWRR
jgi:predicted TIM-barrel fold metal-dependent hydrolase